MPEFNTPFIKKFQIDEVYYIYDVNSNQFFKVDDAVYYLIDMGQKDKKNNSFLKEIPISRIEIAEKKYTGNERKRLFLK